MAYLFAILGLSLLIIVHEAGHMITARLSGMRVNTFSVGFGPTLIRWRGRKTTYQVALIPLGGYVQIAGMNPHDKVSEDDPGSYANKSLYRRFATIFAGPLTNYLLAMVMMVGVMLAWGFPYNSSQIHEVDKGSPAEKDGLKDNDLIVSIDGKKVATSGDVLSAVRQSAGKPLALVVRRAGREQQLRVTPKKDKEGYRIGISFKLKFADVSAKDAVIQGIAFPVKQSRRALVSLGKFLGDLFSSRPTEQQVGGPVEIIHQLKMSFEQSIVMAIVFLAMLSAYLGLFNLLPVPALDGGRLLFLITTMVSRRPINQRIENTVHTVGFILLLALIGLVTYCDFARHLGGE